RGEPSEGAPPQPEGKRGTLRGCPYPSEGKRGTLRGCPYPRRIAMIAMWVKARIKPEQRKRFLEAIEIDALGSERDEAGCYRFNVLQDDQDPNVYYFYEVYKDQAALE